MVWNLSDQGSLRSGTRLIRGGFERTSSAQWSSSAFSSDQRSLRSGTVWSEVPLVWDGLIRGDFERDLNLGRNHRWAKIHLCIAKTIEAHLENLDKRRSVITLRTREVKYEQINIARRILDEGSSNDNHPLGTVQETLPIIDSVINLVA